MFLNDINHNQKNNLLENSENIDYILNESLKCMDNDDYNLLEEINTINRLNKIIRENKGKKDIIREAGGAVDKFFKKIKEKFKGIYKMSDEELIENEVNIFKLIRSVILIGGAVALGGWVAGFVTWFLNAIIQASVTESQKEKLAHNISKELEVINEKLSDEDITKEEKYRLMKLRADYDRALRKLKE